MSLAGKVVVVTGSTSGIGLAIATACARHGASVVVSSRRPQAVADTVAGLENEGLNASGVPADVSDPGQVRTLFDHAIETFGHIDVWVNNAGLSGGYRPLDEFTTEDIRAIVDVNIAGVMFGCRLVIPYFIERGGGIVFNLAGRGSRGDAAPFGAAYAATKAAVTNLTKSLAAENVDQPVSIHQVMPGMVKTGFFEDIEVSPSLRDSASNIELVLDAIGVPAEEVGEVVAKAAAQDPGRVTGKTYSAFKGSRRLFGILKLIGHRMTGRMRPMRRG